MISSVPVSRVSLAQRVVVAGLGQDDADVRQRRLGEDAGDVAVGELALERLDVVELDDPGRLVAGSTGGPTLPCARRRTVRLERGERLVDGAVVAAVEDEDLRPAGELAARAGSRSGWRRSR